MGWRGEFLIRVWGEKNRDKKPGQEKKPGQIYLFSTDRDLDDGVIKK